MIPLLVTWYVDPGGHVRSMQQVRNSANLFIGGVPWVDRLAQRPDRNGGVAVTKTGQRNGVLILRNQQASRDTDRENVVV